MRDRDQGSLMENRDVAPPMVERTRQRGDKQPQDHPGQYGSPGVPLRSNMPSYDNSGRCVSSVEKDKLDNGDAYNKAQCGGGSGGRMPYYGFGDGAATPDGKLSSTDRRQR